MSGCGCCQLGHLTSLLHRPTAAAAAATVAAAAAAAAAQYLDGLVCYLILVPIRTAPRKLCSSTVAPALRLFCRLRSRSGSTSRRYSHSPFVIPNPSV